MVMPSAIDPALAAYLHDLAQRVEQLEMDREEMRQDQRRHAERLEVIDAKVSHLQDRIPASERYRYR